MLHLQLESRPQLSYVSDCVSGHNGPQIHHNNVWYLMHMMQYDHHHNQLFLFLQGLFLALVFHNVLQNYHSSVVFLLSMKRSDRCHN